MLSFLTSFLFLQFQQSFFNFNIFVYPFSLPPSSVGIFQWIDKFPVLGSDPENCPIRFFLASFYFEIKIVHWVHTLFAKQVFGYQIDPILTIWRCPFKMTPYC